LLVAQDHAVDGLQSRTGFEAQLLDGMLVCIAEGLERRGPLTRPILRQHEACPGPFPQRELAGYTEQLVDRAGKVAELQGDLGALLYGEQARLPGLAHQLLELHDVDPVIGELKAVSAVRGGDDVVVTELAEPLAETGDADGDLCHARAGLLLAVDGSCEGVDGDGPTAGKDQFCEYGLLPRCADVHDLFAAVDLQWSKHKKTNLHGTPRNVNEDMDDGARGHVCRQSSLLSDSLDSPQSIESSVGRRL
jgi:hypothetical protein